MRQGLFKVWYLVIGIGLCANAAAEDYINQGLMPAFKFQKNANLLNPHLSSSLDNNALANVADQAETRSHSYEAIFYFPLHRRGVSIDLGVNFRLQEDPTYRVDQPNAYDQDWLNIDPSETRAMVHAAAVFDLPFKGFKAGVTGAYNPDPANGEYDYRAKLSYQWKSGLGLEGGWLHQQKPLEQQNFNDILDVQSLFLDMNYRF